MAKRKITFRSKEERDELINMYYEYIKDNDLENMPRTTSVHKFCNMLVEEHGEDLPEGTLRGWLPKHNKKVRKRKAGLAGARTRAMDVEFKAKVANDFRKYKLKSKAGAKSAIAKDFIENFLKPRGINISYMTVLEWERKYGDYETPKDSQELIGPKPTHIVSVKGQQATFCEDCAFYNACDNEDEDTCRAAIGLRATGKFSYVRKPASPPPVEHTRCNRINRVGNCGMFLSKRETR